MELAARALLAGLAGALAMSAAAYLLRLAGLPSFDFGELIETKLLRMAADHRTRLGTLLHLATGVVLAFGYALPFHVLWPGALGASEWLRGGLYGTVLWLALMVGILPWLGDGFFGSRLGRGVAPVTLLLHLLYGAILAEAYIAG